MSDKDLSAFIVYLKSVSPVDNNLAERDVMFPATIVFGVLDDNTLPVAKIGYDYVGSVKPDKGITAEYGEYLLNIGACRESHADNVTSKVDPAN